MTRDDGAAPQRLRVLVVEDEILVALLLEEMLESLGHEVIGPVATLEKAVVAATEAAPDLAILDVNLRGRETYPVADILRARQVPFIFATGYSANRLPPPYDSGPVLQKPFVIAGVERAIAEARKTTPKPG